MNWSQRIGYWRYLCSERRVRVQQHLRLWYVTGPYLWAFRGRVLAHRLRSKVRMGACLWRVCWRCAQDSGDPKLWALTLLPVLIALWPVLWLLVVAR